MITNFANFVRQVVSNVTKNLPYFKGQGRFYRFFNKVINQLGAYPVVKTKMKDGTSMIVDLRTNTDIDAFYKGRYDHDLLCLVHSLFNQDDYFLDIGANIGFYTVSVGNLLKKNNAKGKVIAFEPFIGNYQRLIENLKLNNLENYCLAQNIGLSNENKQTLITLREDFLTGSATGNAAIAISEEFDQGFTKVPIDLERLDNFWSNFNHQNIKIDLI